MSLCAVAYFVVIVVTLLNAVNGQFTCPNDFCFHESPSTSGEMQQYAPGCDAGQSCLFFGGLYAEYLIGEKGPEASGCGCVANGPTLENNGEEYINFGRFGEAVSDIAGFYSGTGSLAGTMCEVITDESNSIPFCPQFTLPLSKGVVDSFGKQFIEQGEGFAQFYYLNNQNIVTIGYGHTCVTSADCADNGIFEKGYLLLSDADFVLDQDITKYQSIVSKQITNYAPNIQLVQSQINVLIDLAFDFGMIPDVILAFLVQNQLGINIGPFAQALLAVPSKNFQRRYNEAQYSLYFDWSPADFSQVTTITGQTCSSNGQQGMCLDSRLYNCSGNWVIDNIACPGGAIYSDIKCCTSPVPNRYNLVQLRVVLTSATNLASFQTAVQQAFIQIGLNMGSTGSSGNNRRLLQSTNSSVIITVLDIVRLNNISGILSLNVTAADPVYVLNYLQVATKNNTHNASTSIFSQYNATRSISPSYFVSIPYQGHQSNATATFTANLTAYVGNIDNSTSSGSTPSPVTLVSNTNTYETVSYYMSSSSSSSSVAIAAIVLSIINFVLLLSLATVFLLWKRSKVPASSTVSDTSNVPSFQQASSPPTIPTSPASETLPQSNVPPLPPRPSHVDHQTIQL